MKHVTPIQLIFWTTGIILIVCMVTTFLFYQFQDKFVFQGTAFARDKAFVFDQPFEEYFIPADDGQVLNAILFRASGNSHGLILYFHGNRDNLQRWGRYAVDFTTLGYDILMMDYRGYGKSTGTPSETNLYADAGVVLRWAQQNLSYERFVIYGRSLGSAVATRLATEHQPDLLILETPFDEISGAVYAPLKLITNTFPLKYKFSNKEFLPKVMCRKLLIHGTSDWVVPLKSALRLKPLLSPDDRFVIIKGGGHRNLRDFDAFHKAISDALRI